MGEKKKETFVELGMISMALGVPEKARGDRQSHTTLTKTKQLNYKTCCVSRKGEIPRQPPFSHGHSEVFSGKELQPENYIAQAGGGDLPAWEGFLALWQCVQKSKDS